MSSPEKGTTFEKKITKQIEYYFGDKNLPRDKFLLQKLEEDDGWVTMDVLLTFTRLKAIFRDIIANSLRTHGSGLIEINENNTKLRRVKPMPEINDESNIISKEKTIYCKGFPEATTLDEIEEFFEDKGKMRQAFDGSRTFKGSVFVEFETKEEANAFVATKDLKYKDNELTYMTKDEYFKSKKGSMSKSESEDDKTKVKNEGQKEEKDIEYPKGCVIHFSGAGDQTSREDIKELFSVEECSVRYVSFNTGDKEGYIRFAKEGEGEKAMKAVLEKNENKVTLRGEETTLRLIEGDEEKNYWKKAKEDMNKSQRNKRGGRKPQRGGMKRGRRDSSTKDDPPVKQVKSET